MKWYCSCTKAGHGDPEKSANSLYSEEFATFGEDEVYDHRHAGGFIRLFSLSSRIRALNEQKK